MKRKRFDWESLPDSQLLDVRIRDLGVRIEGTWIEECAGRSLRGSGAAGDSVPAACVAFVGLVRAGRCAGDRHPVLSRPSAADEAGAEADAGRRGRDAAGDDQDPAARVRPCARHRLRARQCDARRRELFGDPTQALSRSLPAQSGQPAVTCITCGCTTRRAIRPRTSRRRSRSSSARRRGWRKRYADWPALQKLEYVDELLEGLRGQSAAPAQSAHAGIARRRSA